MQKCLSKEKIYRSFACGVHFLPLFCLQHCPRHRGDKGHAPHFFTKKNYFENFQLFFHKFVSNCLEIAPKIALSNPQNSKNFLCCPTMVGNVNLLRYLASPLQPSGRGPCLNTSTNSFRKRHNFFSRDAKWEEEFGVITWLEERIGVIYGVVAHETCRWRDFVFFMSGIPGFSKNFYGKTVFRTPTNPPPSQCQLFLH